jgi:hypothetical protein
MRKYEPLAAHLRRQDSDHWAANFKEIEAVLGTSLPSSAHRYPAWWANQSDGGHSQAAGWQAAGWRTRNVDLKARRVEFERVSPAGGAGNSLGSADTDAVLFARASDYLGFSDRDRLVREAMKALIEREAARRLARLGGTMPDFEAPPRRRAW